MGGVAVARKLRYAIYDTWHKAWLRQATPSDDGRHILATAWTFHPDEALRFPGIKSAMGMVRKLGSYSEFVVKNEKGEIVG